MLAIKNTLFVSLAEFCLIHKAEPSFIIGLFRKGLIKISLREGSGFIDVEHIQQLEHLITLHYELDINIEGIETITHILERTKVLQEEVIRLENKLKFYTAPEKPEQP